MSIVRRTGTFALGLVALMALSWPATAFAQRVQLSTESNEIYSGMPFVLSVLAEGFEQTPEPTVEAFDVKGAKLDFVGVSPKVSTSLSIVNGHRKQSRHVSFLYRYRVTATKPGTYSIPPIRVKQGSKQASSQKAQFAVLDIETTRDMRVRLGIPERPVWVGESFELVIDWYLRSDPDDPKFVIPIFDQEDVFRVAAPPPAGRRTLKFPVGDRNLELPYERGTENIEGIKYNRFRFFATVTPQRAGRIELPPATVVARLAVGYGRDSFGFRSRRTRIFKAQSPGRTLDVRPLPAQGKPASFAGAVGKRFSIEAQASRTVVRVGDPIELKILVRGDSLTGLNLPPLASADALDPNMFDVPEELPPGEATDDGTGKLFRVTVRLKSIEAREIPELPFSFFDPQTGTYNTVRTQPIALSIAGANVIGAGDVVSATKSDARDKGKTALTTVVDADLSLSSSARTMREVMSIGDLTPMLAALYLLPLLLFFGRTWHLRTREARDQSSGVRRALKAVESELSAAASKPARDSAPAILSALRALASEVGARARGPVIERLETEGYKPSAADSPLDSDLLGEARAYARSLRSEHKKSDTGAGPALALLIFALAPTAWAASLPDAVQQSRQLYAEALEKTDRDARARQFEVVATQLAELNRTFPGRPELLTDWGSAALGARSFGYSTLAYRRALVLDPGLERAESNLHWLRENGPSRSAPQSKESAADTLFFWHRTLTGAQKHLVAAVAFALAMLLLAPFASGRRRRMLRFAAIIPALGVVAMLSSAALADSAQNAVVVVDGSAMLRSADSAGAPPVQSVPPGAGTEATASEEREGWIRLTFADGGSGWMRASAVEHVIPR